VGHLQRASSPGNACRRLNSESFRRICDKRSRFARAAYLEATRRGPHVLAAEIAEDLRSALEQIESVLGDLQQRAGHGQQVKPVARE
jgi:hypothetical protein